MTRDQAVAQVQLILGKRSDLVAEITSQLKFAQTELEHRLELPIFLRKEIFTLQNLFEQERMAPPSDFLREWDEDALYILNEDESKWIPLEKDAPRYLRTILISGPMMPAAYTYDGTDFILYPVPDKVYTFRTIYYAKDQVLDSNIENKWLREIPYLLIGMAGAVMAGGALRDKGALEIFAAMVQEGNARLNSLTVSRDGAGRRYVMGDPD